jgi:hypothetical protein
MVLNFLIRKNQSKNELDSLIIIYLMFSFTLEKGDSPFIQPFSNQTSWRFTLQKGESPYSTLFTLPFTLFEADSPPRINTFTLLKGESSFQKLIHPSKRVIHPLKRVNGRVNRLNHHSKGE